MARLSLGLIPTLFLTSVACEHPFYEDVLKSFEENGRAHCVLWISDEFEDSNVSSLVPRIMISLFEPPQGLKAISEKCKNHVFVLKNENDLQYINPEQLHVSEKMYVFAIMSLEF